jgi:hypothetical protein
MFRNPYFHSIQPPLDRRIQHPTIEICTEAEMAIMTDLLRLMIRQPMPIDVIFNFNGGEETGRQEVPGVRSENLWQ